MSGTTDPGLQGAQAPFSDPERVRQMAGSFGADPERYDRARPRYPQTLVDRVAAQSPGRDVLDVGIGTGITARQLQAAGYKVLGVDVDARMADIARRHGLEVEVAKFEDWEAAGRTFDTIIAAQTWHWIDAVAGAAKAAEVLRPGGQLAVLANFFQAPPDVAERFAAVSRRVTPDAPANWARPDMDAYAEMLLTKIIDGARAVGGFSHPEQTRHEWEWSYTREKWLDQLPTFGVYTRLPPAQLEELLARVGAAIDADGGSFTGHYTTVAITTARTGTG